MRTSQEGTSSSQGVLPTIHGAEQYNSLCVMIVQQLRNLVKYLTSLAFDLTQRSMPSRFPHVLHAPIRYTEDGKRGTTVADMPKDSVEQPDYLSYLLRLWRQGNAERPMWRASLKGVHDGQQVGFANLEDLFHFLRSRTSTMLDAGGEGRESS